MNEAQLEAVIEGIWAEAEHYGGGDCVARQREGIITALKWAHLDNTASGEDIEDAAQDLMLSPRTLGKILWGDECSEVTVEAKTKEAEDENGVSG